MVANTPPAEPAVAVMPVWPPVLGRDDPLFVRSAVAVTIHPAVHAAVLAGLASRPPVPLTSPFASADDERAALPSPGE